MSVSRMVSASSFYGITPKKMGESHQNHLLPVPQAGVGNSAFPVPKSLRSTYNQRERVSGKVCVLNLSYLIQHEYDLRMKPASGQVGCQSLTIFSSKRNVFLIHWSIHRRNDIFAAKGFFSSSLTKCDDRLLKLQLVRVKWVLVVWQFKTSTISLRWDFDLKDVYFLCLV